MADRTPQPGSGPSRSVVVLGPLSRRINRYVVRLAGRAKVGPVAKVRHVGRKSGHTFVIPVLARPTSDGFLIPLFFGSGADWVRNVQQAGGCELEWRRTTVRLENPRVVAANSVRDQVRSAFRAPERAMFAVSGINEYLRLDRR